MEKGEEDWGHKIRIWKSVRGTSPIIANFRWQTAFGIRVVVTVKSNKTLDREGESPYHLALRWEIPRNSHTSGRFTLASVTHLSRMSAARGNDTSFPSVVRFGMK